MKVHGRIRHSLRSTVNSKLKCLAGNLWAEKWIRLNYNFWRFPKKGNLYRPHTIHLTTWFFSCFCKIILVVLRLVNRIQCFIQNSLNRYRYKTYLDIHGPSYCIRKYHNGTLIASVLAVFFIMNAVKLRQVISLHFFFRVSTSFIPYWWCAPKNFSRPIRSLFSSPVSRCIVRGQWNWFSRDQIVPSFLNTISACSLISPRVWTLTFLRMSLIKQTACILQMQASPWKLIPFSPLKGTLNKSPLYQPPT